jgi:DNA repair protein RadD
MGSQPQESESKMNLWPHQSYGLRAVLEAIDAGERRILLTSPTGMGKSVIMSHIIDHAAQADWYAVLYTNRRMLVDQLAVTLSKHGLDFGVRAAGWSDEGRFHPIQISSFQTENARVYEKGIWQLHAAGKQCVVLIDEAHVNNGEVAKRIMADHLGLGHAIVGVTATPLGLGDSYTHLIQAGTVSEGRKCGALLPCRHFAPTEPDVSNLKAPPGEDPSENEVRKVINVKVLWGHVLQWFEKLNPEHKPTILFAPGVAESIWFMQEFNKAGITAAHIDGQEVWINGQAYKSDRDAREAVLGGSKSGEIKVVCNRFVLREGIDAPWLCHGVFATIFGSLQSYLQSGGRLLRSHPGIEAVTLQDHGGHWWRHGSLNIDRIWRLEDTAAKIAAARNDAFRLPPDQKPKEPFLCPDCKQVLAKPKCPCGWEVPIGWKKSRPVIMTDGSLKEVKGEVYSQKRYSTTPEGQKIWEGMFWGARKAKKWNPSFRQLIGFYAHENHGFYPHPEWPFMPIHQGDLSRKVKDVPMDRLHSKPVPQGA